MISDKDYKKAMRSIQNLKYILNFKKKKKYYLIILENVILGDENINEAKNYYLKALEYDYNDKLIVNNLLILFLRIGDKENLKYFLIKHKRSIKIILNLN